MYLTIDLSIHDFIIEIRYSDNELKSACDYLAVIYSNGIPE